LADFQLAMSIMAEAVTIAESNSPRPFPFVRVPMYEAFGAHARQLSGVEFVAWSPVVEEDERDDWSKFVKAERNWYEESKQLAHTNANTVYDGNSTQMRPFIWQGNRSKDAVVEEAPPSKGRSMYPIWQCSPPPHSLMYVNFDMATELYVPDLLPSLQERRLGSMTACNPSFASLPDTMGGEGFQDDFHSGLLDMEHFDDGDHPHAMFIQPVFADLSNNSSKMVGFLSSIVALDSFFSNLLPEGVSGITAVLSNTCGQFYTYELHGREVGYRFRRNQMRNKRAKLTYFLHALQRLSWWARVINTTSSIRTLDRRLD
jgi:hypothetical protein